MPNQTESGEMLQTEKVTRQHQGTPAQASGGDGADKGEGRRRRPRRRGHTGSQGNLPQQVKEVSSQEDSSAQNTNRGEKNRQGTAQSTPLNSQGSRGRGQKQLRQPRNQQEGHEMRENRNIREARRPEGKNQETSRYLPDWGTPPEPNSQNQPRKKPVDQPLSGRSFTRRG